MNRRKYPRLPIANTCDVSLPAVNKSYAGKMVNISAGGFAFACRGEEFAESVGETVYVKIDNFPLAHGKALQGVIIRSSNNAGTYIVGCRMLQDNAEIEEYVKIKM